MGDLTFLGYLSDKYRAPMQVWVEQGIIYRTSSVETWATFGDEKIGNFSSKGIERVVGGKQKNQKNTFKQQKSIVSIVFCMARI